MSQKYTRSLLLVFGGLTLAGVSAGQSDFLPRFPFGAVQLDVFRLLLRSAFFFALRRRESETVFFLFLLFFRFYFLFLILWLRSGEINLYYIKTL